MLAFADKVLVLSELDLGSSNINSKTHFYCKSQQHKVKEKPLFLCCRLTFTQQVKRSYPGLLVNHSEVLSCNQTQAF